MTVYSSMSVESRILINALYPPTESEVGKEHTSSAIGKIMKNLWIASKPRWDQFGLRCWFAELDMALGGSMRVKHSGMSGPTLLWGQK